MGVKGKCDGVAVVFFSVVNDLNMAVTTSVTINPDLIYKKGGRKRPPFRKHRCITTACQCLTGRARNQESWSCC